MEVVEPQFRSLSAITTTQELVKPVIVTHSSAVVTAETLRGNMVLSFSVTIGPQL